MRVEGDAVGTTATTATTNCFRRKRIDRKEGPERQKTERTLSLRDLQETDRR